MPTATFLRASSRTNAVEEERYPSSDFSKGESASNSPSATPSDSPSDSRSSSPNTEQYVLSRKPSLAFFNTPLRRTTNHRFSHLDVVNTEDYKTDTIYCENAAVLDMLCRVIPFADDCTMRMLACLQTLQEIQEIQEINELQVELMRLEQMASSAQQKIEEREEAEELNKFEMLSLFCQLDNEQGDDTESECESSQAASSENELAEEESEEAESESESESGEGYTSWGTYSS